MITVFACGGDGTMYEVLNGIVGYKNRNFGVIPTGSCNDFLKIFPFKNFLLKLQLPPWRTLQSSGFLPFWKDQVLPFQVLQRQYFSN